MLKIQTIDIKILNLNILITFSLYFWISYISEIVYITESIMKYSFMYIVVIEIINILFKLNINTIYNNTKKNKFFLLILALFIYLKHLTSIIIIIYSSLILFYSSLLLIKINFFLFLKEKKTIIVDLRSYDRYNLSFIETFKLLILYPKIKSFNIIYEILKKKKIKIREFEFKSILTLLYYKSLNISSFLIEIITFINELLRRAYLDSKKKVWWASPFIFIYEIIKNFSFLINEKTSVQIFINSGKKIIIVNKNIMFNNKEKELYKKILGYFIRKEELLKNVTSVSNKIPHANKTWETENDEYEKLLGTFNYTTKKFIKTSSGDYFETEKDNFIKNIDDSKQYKFMAFNDRSKLIFEPYKNFFINNNITATHDVILNVNKRIELIVTSQNLNIKKFLINGINHTNMSKYQELISKNLLTKKTIKLIDETCQEDYEYIINEIEKNTNQIYNNNEKIEAIERTYTKLNNLKIEDKIDIYADVLIENGFWGHSKDSLIENLYKINF